MSASDPFLIWGQTPPPPPPEHCAVGPFDFEYEPASGFLRHVRVGALEVLRGIHGAVRDRNWETVPGRFVETTRIHTADEFTVEFQGVHRQDGIDFRWKGRITANSAGTLRYAFAGEAHSDFVRNRIGLCVLLPTHDWAGQPCRITHDDGKTELCAFPDLVAEEQPVRGFDTLRRLEWQLAPDLRAEIEFKGEVFELEDQRNWIDASYKIYGTPLSLPFPIAVTSGARVNQEVTLRLIRAPAPAGKEMDRSAAASLVELASGPSSSVTSRAAASRSLTHLELPDPLEYRRLPDLGLGLASHGEALTSTESDRLAALQLSHLRVDVVLASSTWQNRVRAAAMECSELGLSLELAIHLPADHPESLQPLRELLTRLKADVSRILVFRDRERVTSPDALHQARRELGDLGAPIGGGSPADLYQLHLGKAAAEGDFIAWSMNPQVHASDHRSILETPGAATDQMRTVAARYPDQGRVVSPITLKPRFNPVATVDAGNTSLPPDPRQASLFAAAWTVGMLAGVGTGSTAAESVTLFETSGALGLMNHGSPPLSLLEGAVFPVYHVLRAMAGHRHGACPFAADQDGLASIMLHADDRPHRLVLANLRPEPRRIPFGPSFESSTYCLLDETTLPGALTDPEGFWRGSSPSLPAELEVGPFGILFANVRRGAEQGRIVTP